MNQIFFLMGPVYFLFSFNRAMFILSQIKNVYFFKPNQVLKWSGLKRTYNLCIVKKAKLEISGSPRKPQNFKESKLPKGLSVMVSCEKDLDMDLGKD